MIESDPNFKTAIRASPILLKHLLKGDFSMLKYYVKNGLLERLKFRFPKEQMDIFFNELPETDSVYNPHLELNDNIAIMSYDDVYDEEIRDYEESINASSTFFLLSYRHNQKINNTDSDLQLHFDNRYSHIQKQKEKVTQISGSTPIINRNHTLWWSYNHVELLYLALNGIKVDSTLSGIKPFKLCIHGKHLPIWEVPYSVCDSPNILSATVTIPSKMESLFKKKVTPIVGLFHPESKNRSQWKDFYEYARKYDYKMMTMTDFYKKYLQGK